MIKSLLIANRGEIACRIIRTAREMGIRTIAVYSDADAKALHVRQADEAVHIGPSPAAESYLVGEKIIAAAQETGAEAIHPGYGFLSENADFAAAVQAAGIVWVGPHPDSIRAMGLKDAAKKLMADAGVPVTPGYLGADQSAERLKSEADAIGYPVLIKAVAGGGGKGMRKVDAAQQFLEMLESCKREAKASFGNDHVLLEKWITSPRHIEVQIFGDSHGNVVHLFERDCSLQRRHQKVIEEAPAPGMDEATRSDLCGAAIRAAKAVNYEGAGTVEFIADASEGLRADRIWFMEMNTRLQVEHPVTEEITGVDLVEWQLRVASGEAIPLQQDEIRIDGHAIEARLYAEDPAKGFLPSTGRLDHFYLHDEDRIDTGVELGDEISPFYDPMIAKVIVHASDRDAARTDLMRTLSKSYVAPVRTNAGFLFACLDDENFVTGEVTTGLIEASGDGLMPPVSPSKAACDRAAATFLEANWEFTTLPAVTLPTGLQSFRLNAKRQRQLQMASRGKTYIGDANSAVGAFRDTGPFHTALSDNEVVVSEFGEAFVFTSPPRGDSTGHHHAHDGDILSPMPGKVIAVDVAQGDHVTAGQRLLVLEAMKMEHALTAPFDGVVTELNANEGAQVQVEAVLVRIEQAEE
ncbi:MAG: acetyl/propionyl/methylcrotonyl-CoA carboxylase subunit alpha [Allopontixanthobacter sediminis]